MQAALIRALETSHKDKESDSRAQAKKESKTGHITETNEHKESEKKQTLFSVMDELMNCSDDDNDSASETETEQAAAKLLKNYIHEKNSTQRRPVRVVENKSSKAFVSQQAC